MTNGRVTDASSVVSRYAPVTPPTMPGISRRKNSRQSTLRWIAWLMPDTPVVKHSTRWTPAEALAQFPRWLKGMVLRAERALRDPARDQARMLELKPFADALSQARRRGQADEPGWQALRWDLEELRVSLFAQELGSRGGVSPKKLAQRLASLG